MVYDVLKVLRLTRAYMSYLLSTTNIYSLTGYIILFKLTIAMMILRLDTFATPTVSQIVHYVVKFPWISKVKYVYADIQQ